MFGPPVPVTPDEAGQIVVGVDTRDSAGRPTGKVVPLGDDEFRRTIYVQVRRSRPLGMLEPFDAPLMKPNCELRTSSTVAPQSLLMMNSAFVVEQSEAMAERIEREVGSDPQAQFQRAWLLAYSRQPTEAASTRRRDFPDGTDRLGRSGGGRRAGRSEENSPAAGTRGAGAALPRAAQLQRIPRTWIEGRRMSHFTRRHFVKQQAFGLGGMALSWLLGQDELRTHPRSRCWSPSPSTSSRVRRRHRRRRRP